MFGGLHLLWTELDLAGRASVKEAEGKRPRETEKRMYGTDRTEKGRRRHFTKQKIKSVLGLG